MSILCQCNPQVQPLLTRATGTCAHGGRVDRGENQYPVGRMNVSVRGVVLYNNLFSLGISEEPLLFY